MALSCPRVLPPADHGADDDGFHLDLKRNPHLSAEQDMFARLRHPAARARLVHRSVETELVAVGLVARVVETTLEDPHPGIALDPGAGHVTAVVRIEIASSAAVHSSEIAVERRTAIVGLGVVDHALEQQRVAEIAAPHE